MVEKLLEGPKTYYLWLLFLLCVIAGCGIVYLDQLQNGLSVTGMSRDVSWGLYIFAVHLLSSALPPQPLCWCCPRTSTTIKNSSA